MLVKIQLEIEKKLIQDIENYAQEKEQNISDIVENYFKLLTSKRQKIKANQLSANTQKLRGIIQLEKDFNYKKVLTEELSKKYDT